MAGIQFGAQVQLSVLLKKQEKKTAGKEQLTRKGETVRGELAGDAFVDYRAFTERLEM